MTIDRKKLLEELAVFGDKASVGPISFCRIHDPESGETREFWADPFTMEAATEATDNYIHVREVTK